MQEGHSTRTSISESESGLSPCTPTKFTAQTTSNIPTNSKIPGQHQCCSKGTHTLFTNQRYKPLFHNFVIIHFLIRHVLETEFKILGSQMLGVFQAGAKMWSSLQGRRVPGALRAAWAPRTSIIQSQFYLEPPPFLGLLVLISCQIFTSGSLFFQMSS